MPIKKRNTWKEMLQFDWPDQWPPELLHSVKEGLQRTIRKAMSNNTNNQIRGSVVVKDIQFGSRPPQISLAGIRELSAAHTVFVISVKYSGEAAVTLGGLQLNLDTTTQVNERGEDANHAVPFFCPFEMTLCDLVIDGDVLVEITHEACAWPPHHHSSSGVQPPNNATTTSNGGPSPLGDDHEEALSSFASVKSREQSGRKPHGGIVGGLLLPAHIMALSARQRHHPIGNPAAAASIGLHDAMERGAIPLTTAAVMSLSNSGGGNAGGVGMFVPPPLRRDTIVVPTQNSDASVSMARSIRPSAGLGLLYGAGGRRSMRPPDTPIRETLNGVGAADAASHHFGHLQTHPTPASARVGDISPRSQSGNLNSRKASTSNLGASQGANPLHGAPSPVMSGGAPNVSAGGVGAQSNAAAVGGASFAQQHQQNGGTIVPPSALTFSDIARKSVQLTKRTLRLQFFSDPIKDFKVLSNFESIQGSGRKIEAELKNLMRPAIERLKTQGIEIRL